MSTNHTQFQMLVKENSQLREKIARLEKERDAYGTDLALAESRLEAAGVGLELVDLIQRIVDKR